MYAQHTLNGPWPVPCGPDRQGQSERCVRSSGPGGLGLPPGRAAEFDPLVAAAGHWGKVGLLNAWHTRLSVALQKGNAACLLQAGRVRGSADFGDGTGWDEDIEDLLMDAAAAAAAGGLAA